MKRLLTAGIVAALAASVLALPAKAAPETTGNGAPSGAHYNLNIIGVSNPKSTDMTGNSGHRIFVPLSGTAKIGLAEGDFQVLDANGTDRDGAKFQLPNPDEDGDGVTSYSVYVRALGKPGGSARMQSCVTDAAGDTYCAVDIAGGVEPIDVVRQRGKQSFENVSKDLLYVDICVEWDADGVCLDYDQLPLFSDELAEYFWQYDNNGLRLAQLRFYEVPTTTPWTPEHNAG